MWDFIIIVILLTLSAGFSGLTLGLLSLDLHGLRRKAKLGDTQAEAVLPIRETGNQLLVTLILGNVLVNTILAVFLDSATNGFVAVLLATVLIVIFGEIIPQAVLGRYGLRFGAKLAPALSRVMVVMGPISKPLAAILDRTLGEELQQFYSKDELVKVIEEHSLSEDSDIARDELKIVEHALAFGDKLIEDHYTPRSVVVSVDPDEILNLSLINELHESGHSRFPVVVEESGEVVGLLFLRDIIALKDTAKTKVGDVMSDQVNFVSMQEKLDHALNAFLKTKQHLFIVVNEFQEMQGIITIEDIIEQIMGRKIVDEFDRYDDMREVAHKKAKQN